MDESDYDQSPTQLDEILAARLELEISNEKLQQYNDIIISQANELKTLRSVLCASCKRKLVEATISSSPSSRKETDRQHFLRQPMKKIDPSSSSLKYAFPPPIHAVSAPFTAVGPTRTGLNASPQRSVASISDPPSRPTRTGTPPKLALPPSYISPTADAASSSDSAGAGSSWSVIHAHGSNPYASKLPRPPSKLPRKSALHRVKPSQKTITSDSIPSMPPSELLTSTPISSPLEPVETRSYNGDSESPWSLTHSSDTMTSASPTDLVTFPLNASPTEPSNNNRDLGSPWSVTQRSNDQTLHITFERAFSHNDRVNCVKFSKDGKYIAVGLSGGESNKWNGKAVVYSTETGMEICQLVEHTSEEKKPGVGAVCFSPNGKQLAIGHKDGHIALWLINAKRVRNMFRGGQLSVTSLGFSPNGRTVVSSSLDGTIRLWSLRDGSSRQTLVTTGYTDLRVTFSPIGRYIAAGTGDGVLCILDFRTQELVERWEGHQNDMSSPVFTPDGKGLLSSSFDGTVKYWDVRPLGKTPRGNTAKNSVTLIRQFGGHPHHVRSIAISADGQWVLCGLDDSSALIWNVSNGMQECSLHGHTRRVWSVDMSLVGNCLALGDIDGRVSLWRMKEPERVV